MSQTITPAAPPGARPGGAPAAGPRGPVSRMLAAIRHGLSGTPGHLRIAAGAAIVAAIVAALAGGAALRERSGALEEAQATAAHLVLLQGVRTDLLQADADVTNAFLGFGLEPAAQSRSYATRISAASRGLATVSQGADHRDTEALSAVNEALTEYTALVASARANNRQGLPVGANYLRTASAQLRSDVLPKLQAVAARDVERMDDAYARARGASNWLVVALVLGVGGLVAVQVWLARRSRRVFNPPAAITTAVLAVTLLGAALLMSVAQNQANDTLRNAYQRAESIGEARVAAFDAKSNESLTLILRGSGTPQDEQWREAMTTADGALRRVGDTTELREPLTAYGEAHRTIRQLDDRGDWDRAVRQAVDTRDGSANAAFQRFADLSAGDLERSARDTARGLDEARGGLFPMGMLVLLVGLVAAGGAWWGISLRLDEYR